jgi:hypothetical protein
VVDTDHARDKAVSALDALNRGEQDHSPAYWVGYLASAVEGVVTDLLAGASPH